MDGDRSRGGESEVQATYISETFQPSVAAPRAPRTTVLREEEEELLPAYNPEGDEGETRLPIYISHVLWKKEDAADRSYGLAGQKGYSVLFTSTVTKFIKTRVSQSASLSRILDDLPEISVPQGSTSDRLRHTLRVPAFMSVSGRLSVDAFTNFLSELGNSSSRIVAVHALHVPSKLDLLTGATLSDTSEVANALRLEEKAVMDAAQETTRMLAMQNIDAQEEMMKDLVRHGRVAVVEASRHMALYLVPAMIELKRRARKSQSVKGFSLSGVKALEKLLSCSHAEYECCLVSVFRPEAVADVEVLPVRQFGAVSPIYEGTMEEEATIEEKSRGSSAVKEEEGGGGGGEGDDEDLFAPEDEEEHEEEAYNPDDTLPSATQEAEKQEERRERRVSLFPPEDLSLAGVLPPDEGSRTPPGSPPHSDQNDIAQLIRRAKERRSGGGGGVDRGRSEGLPLPPSSSQPQSSAPPPASSSVKSSAVLSLLKRVAQRQSGGTREPQVPPPTSSALSSSSSHPLPSPPRHVHHPPPGYAAAPPTYLPSSHRNAPPPPPPHSAPYDPRRGHPRDMGGGGEPYARAYQQHPHPPHPPPHAVHPYARSPGSRGQPAHPYAESLPPSGPPHPPPSSYYGYDDPRSRRPEPSGRDARGRDYHSSNDPGRRSREGRRTRWG